MKLKCSCFLGSVPKSGTKFGNLSTMKLAHFLRWFVRLVLMDVILFLYRSTVGGGFKYVLFSPLFGEDSHFD